MTMDEIIEKISAQVEKEVSGLLVEEQPYVYREIADRLVRLASEALLMAYPVEEDEA